MNGRSLGLLEWTWENQSSRRHGALARGGGDGDLFLVFGGAANDRKY